MENLFLLLHRLALPGIQAGGHLPNRYPPALTPREASHEERSSFASIVPNPPLTPPYSTSSRSSKRKSQLSRLSQGSTRLRSPVRIIQSDSRNLVRLPSPIEIAIPPPMADEKPIYSPRHSYRKSDASIIYPLPATVYVPGEGDVEDRLLPKREGDGGHPLEYWVALGGEAGGRDSPCPVVVEERSILQNLGMGSDSFLGVGNPAE